MLWIAAVLILSCGKCLHLRTSELAGGAAACRACMNESRLLRTFSAPQSPTVFALSGLPKGIPRAHTVLPANVCTSEQASLPEVQPLAGFHCKKSEILLDGRGVS